MEPNNPRHSSKTDNWGTPHWIASAAREVLRGIDLDPASCAKANEVICARKFFSKEDDGLLHPWVVISEPSTSIFVNPPGGLIDGNQSKVKRWWQKLLVQRQVNRDFFRHALFLSFSIESVQVTQIDCEHSLLEFPTCFFSSRVSYTDLITGEKVTGNTHSSCITYVPGLVSDESLFRQVFSKVGDVVICARRRVRT